MQNPLITRVITVAPGTFIYYNLSFTGPGRETWQLPLFV